MSTVANPHPAAVTTAYSAVVTPRSVRRRATGDLVMRTSWTGPPCRWAVVAVTLAPMRTGHEGPFRLWGRRPDLVPCGGKPDGSSADQHGHRPRHQRHHTHQDERRQQAHTEGDRGLHPYCAGISLDLAPAPPARARGAPLHGARHRGARLGGAADAAAQPAELRMPGQVAPDGDRIDA